MAEGLDSLKWSVNAADQVQVFLPAPQHCTEPADAEGVDLTEHDFHEIMDVNVLSAILGMQTIVPHFQARGEGHLINVSSFLGRVPLATFRSAYNAAKAALNGPFVPFRQLRRRHFARSSMSSAGIESWSGI